MWVTLRQKRKIVVCPPRKFENGGRQAEGFFFFHCSNTVLTNGFGKGGWIIIYQVCAVHSDIVTTYQNWCIVSAIVHIEENKLTAIIKVWRLKTASFVQNLKNKINLTKNLRCRSQNRRGWWRASKHLFLRQ